MYGTNSTDNESSSGTRQVVLCVMYGEFIFVAKNPMKVHFNGQPLSLTSEASA